MTFRLLVKAAFSLAALAVLANATPAAAQQRGTIRGTVREADTQRPVPGVQVFVQGTSMSTVTDAQGRFEFTGVLQGGAIVRVRAVGYSAASATTTVGGGQTVTVDFALNESVIALDEVVVTGTGATQERKQLGNTIATVRADMIQDAPIRDFSEAIAAREAGVSILPSSGLAGEGARIRIRGNASLSMSNEPVVYLDGVRIDNGGGFSEVGAGGAGEPSRLDDINPETIERIEILKGAAAATLYGSEASAGVIQIFTKKGTQGRPRFTFRIDQGLSRFPGGRVKANHGFARTQAQADQLNAIHQGRFEDANGNGSLEPFEVAAFPHISSAAYYGTGYSGSYSATVSGGGADAVYNVAGRYSVENGPYDVTDLVGTRFLDQLPYDPGKIDYNRKYHLSGNTTLFPKDRLSLSLGLMFTDVHHQTPENANNIYGVQSSLLNAKPERGNCQESINQRTALEADGINVGTYGENLDRPGECAGPGNVWGNRAFSTPRENAFSRVAQDAEHFNANGRVSYTPIQGRLALDLVLGVDVSNTRDHNLLPFKYDVDDFSNNADLGYKGFGSRFHRELSVDAKANWTERFGMLSSQLTLGTQGFITKTHVRGGSGTDFPGPGLEVADAAASQEVDEGFSEVVNLGLLAQEQIGINDWAFVTLGGRWDRNSAFGENTSGAFYPKASLSLVVSDMPTWTNSTISTLRFRGAVGRSGLQPGAFDELTTFSAQNSQTGSGLVPDNLGNPDLKPEVTLETEFGAEVGLLNNRLAVEGTRWDRKTTDALVARQYVVTGGFLSPQLSNIGELKASGWEFKVNALVVDRPGVSINVFANGAYLFQKITSMGGAPALKVGGSYPRYRNFLVEGQTPGVALGAQILQPCGQTQYSLCLGAGQVPFDTDNNGVPDSRAELEAYLSQPRELDLFYSPTGRGTLWDDNDNDGDFLDHCLAETRADGYCTSKPMPDWAGAFGTDITIARNFRISTLFEYKFGNYYVQNLTDAFRNSNPLIGRNNPRPAEIEAIMENPASTAAERADALMEFAENYQALAPYSGLNLAEKADFLRWREMALTYDAPSAWAQALGFANLSFNLSGRNLVMVTGYPGIDPEMNSLSRTGTAGLDSFEDGIDAWGFPLPRRFTFSVRFGF